MIVKFPLFLFKIQSHQSVAIMSKYKLMAYAFISMSKVQRFKKLVCVCMCISLESLKVELLVINQQDKTSQICEQIAA